MTAEVKHKPLTAKQHQAAELLGSGRTHAEAAREVGGVTARTVRRWAQREDFKALVNQGKARRLDENPTARAVLEDCLTACHSNGKADMRTRLAAARALLPLEAAEKDGDRIAERITYVHVDELEPDDGD